MTTNATLEKFKEFAGASDLSVAEIKLVLKHWEDATSKLKNNVIRSVKSLDKIPDAVQVELVDLHEKSVRAIGELLCPEAQDLVIKEFPEDLQLIVRKALAFKSISMSLWKHLASLGKDGELSNATLKKLSIRKDCPPQFLKAVGIDEKTASRTKAKATVKKLKPRAAKTVKAKSVDEDEDFDNVRKVARVVKTVKRPRA